MSTECTSRLRALDVREELVSQPGALRRALDQARDVGQHELAAFVVLEIVPSAGSSVVNG